MKNSTHPRSLRMEEVPVPYVKSSSPKLDVVVNSDDITVFYDRNLNLPPGWDEGEELIQMEVDSQKYNPKVMYPTATAVEEEFMNLSTLDQEIKTMELYEWLSAHPYDEQQAILEFDGQRSLNRPRREKKSHYPRIELEIEEHDPDFALPLPIISWNIPGNQKVDFDIFPHRPSTPHLLLDEDEDEELIHMEVNAQKYNPEEEEFMNYSTLDQEIKTMELYELLSAHPYDEQVAILEFDGQSSLTRPRREKKSHYPRIELEIDELDPDFPLPLPIISWNIPGNQKVDFDIFPHRPSTPHLLLDEDEDEELIQMEVNAQKYNLEVMYPTATTVEEEFMNLSTLDQDIKTMEVAILEFDGQSSLTRPRREKKSHYPRIELEIDELDPDLSLPLPIFT